MTWTKLGSEFLDIAEDLSPDAALAHVEVLLYSNRRGLDHPSGGGDRGRGRVILAELLYPGLLTC